MSVNQDELIIHDTMIINISEYDLTDVCRLNIMNAEFENQDDVFTLLSRVAPKLTHLSLSALVFAEEFQFPTFPNLLHLSIHVESMDTAFYIALFTACASMRSLAWGGSSRLTSFLNEPCLLQKDLLWGERCSSLEACKLLPTIAPNLTEFHYHFGEQDTCRVIEAIGAQLTVFDAPFEVVSTNVMEPFIRSGKLQKLHAHWFQIGQSAVTILPQVQFTMDICTLCFMPSFISSVWTEEKHALITRQIFGTQSKLYFRQCFVNGRPLNALTLEAFTLAVPQSCTI